MFGQCPGTSCTYTISGADSGAYTVNTGEKICFDAGANFTGGLNLYGGEMVNCATSPQTFTLNTSGTFPNGTINNYGTITFSTGQSIGNGLIINNHDALEYTNLSINTSAKINNYGTVTLSSYLTLSGELNNENDIVVGGDFNAGSVSVFDNSGNFQANTIDVSGFWTNSGIMTSNGYSEFKSASVGSIEGGCLNTNSFTNRGAINGLSCGNITINTASSNTSGASLTGSIAIIDLTPPGSAPFIDTQNGTVGPNIVWTTCNSCAPEICGNATDDNGDGRIDESFPGGVQSDMQLWLRAETGTNTTTNGSDVTSWADQSINGYSANADVNSTDDPIYSENELNYNPGIVFDGTYTDDFSDGLHLGSDYIYSSKDGVHIFVVANPTIGGLAYDKIFDFGGTASDGYGFTWSSVAARMNTPTGSGGITRYFGHATGVEPSFLEFEIKFNADQTLYKDGIALVSDPIASLNQLTNTEIAESDHYGTSANGDELMGPVSIGRKSASQHLDQDRVFMGGISEVLVYNDTLTQVEKEKIQSYLALKYGFGLPHDYVSSTGTSLKSITDGYANNVFGIGRDDCSGLYQKQSKSVGDDGILTLSLSDFQATNQANTGTIAGDESFLFTGDNGAALNGSWPAPFINTDYTSIDRIWKLDVTNYSESTKFVFDVDDPDFNLPTLPGNSDGNYYIILDDDGDLTNGGTTTNILGLESGSLYSTTIPTSGFNYFSIGSFIPPPEELCGNLIDDNADGRIDESFPGGVQSDMQLWLRAETGTNTTTDGSDVTSWTDQSVNAYSANADVNSTDDPTFTENAINFNPGVDFDGTFTDGYSDGLHLGADYIFGEKDGLHVFIVCDPDVVAGTDQHIFDFGLAANGGYGMIYSDNDYGMYTNNGNGGTNTELLHAEGEEPALVEMKVDFGDTQEFYRNGSLLSSIPVTISNLDETKINEAPAYGSTVGNESTGPVSIGRKSASVYLDQNSGRIFDGRISEVIVFTDILSSIEKQKVNSYLAVKYGLTISENYISSSGTIKKNITDGYINDIAGIGRDNCGGLFQKQSKSANSDGIITFGLETIAASNQANTFTSMSDGSFLIWANNGAAENASWSGLNYDIPNGGYLGIDRVWKLDESLTVQNVVLRVDVDNLDFDLPALPPYPGSDGTYHLFIDDDGDFTNGGTTSQQMNFVSGSEWETTIAEPTSGYFSIGMRVSEICNNGIDDDGDGDIDGDDSDCCVAQAPVLIKN